jgi:hypothetical protein
MVQRREGAAAICGPSSRLQINELVHLAQMIYFCDESVWGGLPGVSLRD